MISLAACLQFFYKIMERFVKQVEIRWSDIDANMHLRHSVYYDWGAYVRMAFMQMHGIDLPKLTALKLGPVLLREEAVFRKEIAFEDKVAVDLSLVKAKRDFSRIGMRHEIIKNGDTLSAIVTVDYTWIDTVKRKLAIPPYHLVACFDLLPKHESFAWDE